MSRVLFLSPHNDDETLFGSFIIQQELPEVWVITDGVVQLTRGQTNATSQTRRSESLQAIKTLMGDRYDGSVRFVGQADTGPEWLLIHDILIDARTHGWDRVYAPYPEPHESHHVHHNQLGKMAAEVFPQQVRFYTTYTRVTGKTGRSTPNAREYQPTDGGQVQRKLRALACYRSQMDVHNCREHFMRDLKEYVVDYRPGEMWWEIKE